MFAAPSEADFIQTLPAFTAHFESASTLPCYPITKRECALDLVGRHVAVTFACLERLESRKCLFPPTVTFAPDKTDFIKLRFSPFAEVILCIPLNRNPLAQTIGSLTPLVSHQSQCQN